MNYLKLYYNTIKDFLFNSFTPPPKILNIDETIDVIIKNKLSVSRFGDGELSLLLNIGNPDFQHSNLKLIEQLHKTITSNLPQLLICIPKVFENSDLERMTRDTYKFWHRYIINNREAIYHLLNFSKLYGDTQFTRNYIDNKDKSHAKQYFIKIKRIWDNRNVIIIEGKYTRFGVNNNLLNNAKSIKRILCPEKDAYNKYNDILIETLKQDKNILFLIALGPTATILAYDLCKNGYQAIDIGHLDIEYEWFLAGVNKKIAIKNKYVNETNDIINCENDTLNNPKYQEQILIQII